MLASKCVFRARARDELEFQPRTNGVECPLLGARNGNVVTNRPLAVAKEVLEHGVIAEPQGLEHGAQQGLEPPGRFTLFVGEATAQGEEEREDGGPREHEDRSADFLSRRGHEVRSERVEVGFVFLRQGVLVCSVGDEFQIARRRLRVVWVQARESFPLGGLLAGCVERAKQGVGFEWLGCGDCGDDFFARGQFIAVYEDVLVGGAPTFGCDDCSVVFGGDLVNNSY